MSKIRGVAVATPMKRSDFNQTDPTKSDFILNNPIPRVTSEDNGKVLQVINGKWGMGEVAEGGIVESLESYSDEVTVDEGASATFASNYEEGYAEGYEQGQREGGGITEDWVRENFLPLTPVQEGVTYQTVLVQNADGTFSKIPISNGTRPNAIAVRDATGFVITPTGLAGYSSEDASERRCTPKYYVDQLLDEKIGDISSALDELHTYAQNLINGGNG